MADNFEQLQDGGWSTHVGPDGPRTYGGDNVVVVDGWQEQGSDYLDLSFDVTTAMLNSQIEHVRNEDLVAAAYADVAQFSIVVLLIAVVLWGFSRFYEIYATHVLPVAMKERRRINVSVSGDRR